MVAVRSSEWTPIVGWLAATATSIVLASVALLPVLRTTAPEDSALAALPAADASSFPAPLPSVTTPSPAAPSAVSPSTATTTTTTRPRPTKTTKPTAKPTTTPPKTTTTTTTPPTTTEDGWTVTTGADGVRTYVRSFKVEGGQAVIRMTSDGVVSLVTATPADGWAVQKVQDSPGNLAVYFNETNHSFIIHATWWDDRPFVEVSEIGS
ncbi:DNA mismatch repair protein MutL [Actinoplanes sp. NPDC048796]|uniref:DNA mismatch repair protein MutL n=1 Tax=Actinoplanes sp. NPDC048796 TaxID=3155640 RepID=UPI0033D93C6A